MIQEEVIKTNEAVDISWSVPTAGILVTALVKFSAAPYNIRRPTNHF